MEIPEFHEARDPSHRRNKVACASCGRSIEIVRLRDHLRAEHNLTTAAVDEVYLAAMMGIRKTRRGRI
jgi:hypothetical protein